jgi:N-acetyl-gamma-glutamyl-phosphate reductase
MKKVKIGLLGATGYTGIELLKMLENHPHMEVVFVTSEKHAGKTLASFFPNLTGRPFGELRFIPASEAIQIEVDGVFSCLPHQTAAENLLPFIQKGGVKIVDLSADFRIRDAEIYKKYYHEHPNPELLSQAVYGLVEWEKNIKDFNIVGNPGCYPTSILLPLLPLVKAGLIETTGIIADSKSGVSGAGKSPSDATHYVEVNENFSAYKVADEHRHLSEINEQLSITAKLPVNILFTPHLVPMTRGILSTIYAKPKAGVTRDQILACLQNQYAGQACVQVLEKDFPKTAWVANTNRCMFGFKITEDGQTLVIVSVIDNLIKGASGQGLQNMNILFGLEQNCGVI